MALQESQLQCSLASVSPPSCPAILQGLGWPPLRGMEKGCCQPLKADGSKASTALPQASPARVSARIPLPLPHPHPHPHRLGQTSASRPPSFDQYRASSQGGCRLHPPKRPQLSQGHRGEGLQPGSGALGGGAGQRRAGKAGITHRVIYSFTHSLFRSHWFSAQILREHQLCTRPVIGSGGTVRTAPVELMFWGKGWGGEITQRNK